MSIVERTCRIEGTRACAFSIYKTEHCIINRARGHGRTFEPRRGVASLACECAVMYAYHASISTTKTIRMLLLLSHKKRTREHTGGGSDASMIVSAAAGSGLAGWRVCFAVPENFRAHTHVPTVHAPTPRRRLCIQSADAQQCRCVYCTSIEWRLPIFP